MKTPTQETDFCRVVVVNEVLGTREAFTSAWGVKETLAHHGAVTRAVRWSEDYDLSTDHRCYSAFSPPPISVCVITKGNVVTVRWYATGERKKQNPHPCRCLHPHEQRQAGSQPGPTAGRCSNHQKGTQPMKAWLFQDHRQKQKLGDKCPWSVGRLG